MDDHPTSELEAKQLEYWSGQEASVDGMLGGFGSLDGEDIRASTAFLDRVMPRKQRCGGRALDCGAGIGRVTKHLLIPAGFEPVDLLDINQGFLDQAPAFVGVPGALGERYCSSLAAFDFGGKAKPTPYRLVWVQW